MGSKIRAQGSGIGDEGVEDSVFSGEWGFRGLGVDRLGLGFKAWRGCVLREFAASGIQRFSVDDRISLLSCI